MLFRSILVPVLRLGIPDVLVDHASPDQSKETLGLTPPQMAARILQRFPSGFSGKQTDPDRNRVMA